MSTTNGEESVVKETKLQEAKNVFNKKEQILLRCSSNKC
jgi:hypothetical protein